MMSARASGAKTTTKPAIHGRVEATGEFRFAFTLS
jgi:hypothetical protein